MQNPGSNAGVFVLASSFAPGGERSAIYVGLWLWIPGSMLRIAPE
jgi:hypothetical protein